MILLNVSIIYMPILRFSHCCTDPVIEYYIEHRLV